VIQAAVLPTVATSRSLLAAKPFRMSGAYVNGKSTPIYTQRKGLGCAYRAAQPDFNGQIAGNAAPGSRKPVCKCVTGLDIGSQLLIIRSYVKLRTGQDERGQAQAIPTLTHCPASSSAATARYSAIL